jgi:hypothetical protein
MMNKQKASLSHNSHTSHTGRGILHFSGFAIFPHLPTFPGLLLNLPPYGKLHVKSV